MTRGKRYQREIAHDYAPIDLEAACVTNLAARLFVTAQAGKTDWKRWAAATGDQEVIDAVDAAVKAVAAAHRAIVRYIRRKPGKDAE